MLLENVKPSEELASLAGRRSKSEEFKTVRNPLVGEEEKNGWIVQKHNKNTTRLRRPKRGGSLFEDRVWTLLYRMGFHHLSDHGGAFLLLNHNDPKGPDNQIDVVAIDDEVAFAIECKSSEAGRKFGDFTSNLAKHVLLRERFTRAVREQFTADSKRPSIFAIWTTGISITPNDLERAAKEKVAILTESDLNYYEKLVSEIGLAGRFQFLADLLQQRAVPGLEITVPAIRAKIGGRTSYIFSVSPAYLLKIAFVSHRIKGKPSDIDAYQRLLNKGRLKSIREYISDGGIFPTNIVVNVAKAQWLVFERGKQENDGGASTFGWLQIRPAYRVAWIIDGQHRLFAYANHPLASKSLVSVMAFVGLEPSEQARLFVDINAKQKRVKQSLLQELYAELHWDAGEPEVRLQAILSKVVQAIDLHVDSPFRNRILKADDARSELRCISLTSVFHALEQSGLFFQKIRRGTVVDYGPLWADSNDAILKRTVSLVIGYFSLIRAEANELWEKGSADGGGLSMNDGVTVCLNVLSNIINHLESVQKINLSDLADDELLQAVSKMAKMVGAYFYGLSAEQMKQFRALRGVQGQTTGTRRIQQKIREQVPTFNAAGLTEFLARERAQTTTRAFEVIRAIEHILQTTVLSELKSEYGEDETGWWFGGVPKAIRKKIDDKINEEGGKEGGREEKFELISYRDVILNNFTLFEGVFARGKGAKDFRTRWLVEVNSLRKPVMHASRGQGLPISEEQLAFLEEILEWLELQISTQKGEKLEFIAE